MMPGHGIRDGAAEADFEAEGLARQFEIGPAPIRWHAPAG